MHNKASCNLNVYYFPPLSNILQVEQNKNNMVYFQPFSIAIIKVQDISIFSTFISNVTYTLLPQENSPNHIQSRIILKNDSQSYFSKDK